MAKPFTISCPAPANPAEFVMLAHGGGGRLMHQLLERFVITALRS